MAPEPALMAEMQASVEPESSIVLKPLSHPELGDIRIEDDLFAIGRTEAPFASYSPEEVADLSRRHARIFAEFGGVYVADLGSKNGTRVNGVEVRQKPARLRHGDELCFGRALAYRVELGARAGKAGKTKRLLSLTLSPERSGLGLQPIVVSRFPFLIGKTDAAFARYKDEHPQQVNYLSRRHAHIFLKGGTPCIEDLGSTNGTFLAGKRLDEHAAPLKEGDLLAFGGHHFVYRVALQEEECEVEPTLTKLASPPPGGGAAPCPADKTTFVAAADSFLDIFCIDPGPPDKEANEAEAPADAAGKEADKRRSRSKAAIFLSELRTAFAESEDRRPKRTLRWATALAAALGVAALAWYLGGSSEREVRDLLAGGEYARAASAADAYLARHPDDGKIQSLGTEALLKAGIPPWLARLQARDFAGAGTALAGLRQLGSHNAEIPPLAKELELIGRIEEFATSAGGAEAPIRIYADEEKIKALLKQWDEEAPAHPRVFATISSHVPEFKDAYARVLSHLRKLQSDDAVYLAAIERLKAAIAAELKRGHPEALEAVLQEYAEKYPRLGGLESVRQDLRRYRETEKQARSPRLGPLVALLAQARFSTPPFQARFQALAPSLPPAEIVRQYEAVAKSWREGDARQAFAALEKMAASGPWAEKAAGELAHKKEIAESFAELQKARGAKGYDERLLAFYGALDAGEDDYFLWASETELGLDKKQALARAQALSQQALARWRRYREAGAIEGRQRLEAGISSQFRSQARLLAEARSEAQQGLRIHAQLKAEYPAEWRQAGDEIDAEAERQRRFLLDLRGVLEPGLLQAKLALLGARSDDAGQSP